jgi:hypothetical protein
VAGLGLALAGALLTGCHAQGTFDVLSEERVAVDLTITGADVNCPHGADALKLTVTTTIDQYGDQVCHVTGETQATYFSPFGITITPAAEYLVLQANLAGGRDSWPASDIDIRFPGKVMDASLGSVSDNVVRITDLEALTQGSGLHAVGLRSGGPPQWMIAAAAGAGAGIVVTLIAGLIIVLMRRSRRRAPASLHAQAAFPEAEAEAEAGDAAASLTPAPLTILSPAEPVPASSDGRPPSPLQDTSWFARPPAATEATNGKAANRARATGAEPHLLRAAPPLQHVAWARPPDPSDDKKAG